MNIQRALEGAGELSVHPSVSALHIPAPHAFIPFQPFSGITVPDSVTRSRPDDNNNKTVVSVVAAVSGLCPALPVVSMQHQSQLAQAVVAAPALIPAVVAPVAVQTTGAFAPGSGSSDMASIGIAPSQSSASGIALTCSIGNPLAVSDTNILAVGNAPKSSPSISTPANKTFITSGAMNPVNLHVSATNSGSNLSNSGNSPSSKSSKPNSSSNSIPNSKIPNSSSSHNLTPEQTDDLVKPVFKDGELVLEVECGQNKGILYLSKLCQGSKGPCISFQSSWLTPNEFQFVSGRETAKDWKRSIRHHGKSLKLLLAKGILNVHPTMCDCDGCRQGATLTRKGEKRRIPNGERKIRKPINNNNTASNNSGNNSSSSSNNSNGNATNNAANNHHNSSNNNISSSKLPANGGADNPASATFRPLGSAIVSGQLSPGGAQAKPEVKRPGVDKAPKVADAFTRFPAEIGHSGPVFPSNKACLVPIAPHGLIVSANLSNQAVIGGQPSSSFFSPIKPPLPASPSSSSSSPSPTSPTPTKPLSLSMSTVPLPLSSSAASSLLFASSATKASQPFPFYNLTTDQSSDSPNSNQDGKSSRNSGGPGSPDVNKTSHDSDEQSCDEDDDVIEEDDRAVKEDVEKEGEDSELNECDDGKEVDNDEANMSELEDSEETNVDDNAKSDVSFESSDEECDEQPEKPKQTTSELEDSSNPVTVTNCLSENQEPNKDTDDIAEETHTRTSSVQDANVERSSNSTPTRQQHSDTSPTSTFPSSVPCQSSSALASQATLATVISSATMSVSTLAGVCSQPSSATASNNVKSEHIWVPPTLPPNNETERANTSVVSTSVTVKSEDPISVGASRGISHLLSSQEESKIPTPKAAPSHQKSNKEGEFNFRSVSDLCAPMKKEPMEAKLMSPTSSSSSDRNRDREREERQRQRLREERNRKDKEREERREKERREERERESERRRAEDRRDYARSQSEVGSKHDTCPSSVTPVMNLDPMRRPPGGPSEAAAFSDYMRVLAASHGNAFLQPGPAAYMQPMLSLRPTDPRMASQLLSPLAAASYQSSLAVAGLPKDHLLYPGANGMMPGMTSPGLPPQFHPFLQRHPFTPQQSSVLDYQRSLSSAAAAAYSWPSPYSYLLQPDLGAASMAAAAAASVGLKRPSSELEAAMDLNAKRMRLEGRSTDLGSHWDYLAAAAAAQRPQMSSLSCGLESANMDKTTEYLRKKYMEYGPQAAYLSALPEYARTMYHCACPEHRDEDIRLWNVEDVCKFLSSLDGCAVYADHFREQRVDGRILALLSTDHLMKTLGMKLGPALLLYEAVAKKLQDISKMSNCEACRSIAMSQPTHPMAMPL